MYVRGAVAARTSLAPVRASDACQTFALPPLRTGAARGSTWRGRRRRTGGGAAAEPGAEIKPTGAEIKPTDCWRGSYGWRAVARRLAELTDGSPHQCPDRY